MTPIYHAIRVAIFLALTSAAWALSNTTEVVKFKDASANAFFESVDATGCLILDVNIEVSMNIVENGQFVAGVGLEISAWDNCLFYQVLFAQGLTVAPSTNFSFSV